MRNGIFVHEDYIGPENVDELRDMSFVFMCLEGPAKKLIVEKLEEFGLPFIDVGMGVYLSEGSLGGILRVTTSTPAQRDHVRKRDFVLGRRRPQRIRRQYPDRRPERAECGAGGDQVEEAGGLLPGSRLRASLHLYDRRQHAAQRRCAAPRPTEASHETSQLKPPKTLTHEFVEFIPDVIEEGKIYVSIEYATAVHKCCLRLRKRSGDAAEPHGLEAHFRRQDDFARSLDRQLELPVPVALLGQERPGAMGGGLVAVARRCQPRA